MTHAPLRSLRATTALCAVLALGSTPAWAQDAATVPEAVVAPASPSAAPQPAQPTIVLPAQAPAPAAPPMTSQPMVQQAPQAATMAPPEEAAPVRTTAGRRPAARTATAAPRAPVPAGAAPSAAEPVTTPPVMPMPPAASVPLAQPAVAPPPASITDTRAASDTPMGLTPAAWVAGLIVLFGGGAAAYFAMRSRRREDEVYEEAYETEPAQTYVEPEALVVEPMAANEPTGGLVPEAPLPAFAMVDDTIGEPAAKAVEPTPHPTDAQRMGSEELAPAAEPFVMPAGPVPQTRAERDALLEAMVAAPPDAENPFTSRKGRMRRARMILAAREYDQAHEATQPFDWRTYKPSTSHPAPATPPRVTA